MKLLRELRRRRVFRLAGVYVVSAWVVIEVSSVFFPAWGIPDTALRYLFIAAALLFPVAIVFSWVFDVTANGIVRTGRADPGESVDLRLQKTDYAILAALAAVAVLVVLGSLERVAGLIEEPAFLAVEKPPNSIAVLPFEPLDDNPVASAYGAGVSEAILHRLASLGTLKVLARTSSFAFRDSANSPRELADILGVRYLLQGTVKREGQRVYLSATLVEDSGFEVWNTSLEGGAADIFALQDTVTREVAGRVGDPATYPTITGGVTANPLAYQHYLVGMEFANDRPAGWQEIAEQAFRRSIAEDPDFAPAYAGLAMALFIGGGESDAVERKDEAFEKAAHAYALEPSHPDVLAVMGLVLLEGDNDALLEARQYLERAISLDPSNSDAYNWLASGLANLGLDEQAAEIREQGLAVDPLNPSLVTNVADRIAGEGNFDRAMAIRMRLLDLPEPPGVGLWGIYRQYIQYDNIAEGIYWAKQTALAYGGTQNQTAFFTLAELYARLGMEAEAEYWNEMLKRHHPDRFATLIRQAYLAKLTADFEELEQAVSAIEAMGVARSPRLPDLLKRRLGALFMVAGHLDTGLPLLEDGLGIDAPLTPRFVSHETAEMSYYLATVYRSQGDDELADSTLERADAIVAQLRSDGLFQDSPSEIELLVLQHVFRNDLQSAAIALRSALDAGWANYYWYYNDPIMGPYARSPELAPLFEEALRTVEKQRQIVIERDATDKFKERIALMLEHDDVKR